MIYQLAKTSPLLTGQVKMNLILNGNVVTDLQYTPISEYISFPRTRKPDTLNYTHGENVRMLYKQNSDSFFKPVQRPDLSYTSLYKANVLYRDTHDWTYEMSLRRIPYQRYGKQFEFFCPFWCDTREELENLEFVLVIENNNGRKIFQKTIDWGVIQKYILKFVDAINLDTTKKNNELLHIDFDKYESHIKGLCAEDGNIHTFDTTYILDKLLECERTVLETDSTILSVFSAQKIISTQLFNFSFIFNVEDIVPLQMVNELVSDRINMYVDMYSTIRDDSGLLKNKVKVELKDLYSNYEFIPKYNVESSKLSKTKNVLDYMRDYDCVDIMNTNKYNEAIFHLALRDVGNEIFNLYSGFSPCTNRAVDENLVQEVDTGKGLSNNITDLYTDTFDIDKNPFGIFKYNNITDLDRNKDYDAVIDAINADSSYIELDLTTNSEFTNFGNLLIDTSKLDTSLSIEKIYAGLFVVNNGFTYNDIEQIISNYTMDEGTITSKLEAVLVDGQIARNEKRFLGKQHTILYHKNYTYYIYNSENCLLLTTVEKNGNSIISIKYVFICIAQDSTTIKLDEVVKNLFFDSLTNFDFVRYNRIANGNAPSNIEDYGGNGEVNRITYSKFDKRQFQENDPAKIQKYRNESTENMARFAILANCLKAVKLTSKVNFTQTLINDACTGPLYTTKELTYNKVQNSIELQRYGGNLYPMFIDASYKKDNDYYHNYIYWNKQYIAGQNTTELTKFNRFVNTKYAPIYKSIDFYPLESVKLNYENFYLDDKQTYILEKSWYKDNAYFFLQSTINETTIKEIDKQITKDDICEIIYNKMRKQVYDNSTQSQLKTVISEYIYDLYTWSCTYDYVSEKDINNIKYDIKITLK